MYVVDSQTMRRLDAAVIAAGTPSLTLMERAGAGAARAVLARPTWLLGTALVLCGRGNNGGDGLVVARWLKRAGHDVRALLMNAEHEMTPDAAHMLRLAREAHVPIDQLDDDAGAAVRDADARHPGRLWIDALLGTGARLPLEGRSLAAVSALNAAGRRVVALDVPSGLDATSGAMDPEAVRADLTVTFGCTKWGLVLPAGRRHVGRIERVDLEFPRAIVERELRGAGGDLALFVDAVLAAGWWRERPVDAHKHSVGTVLAVGGSQAMSGAVALACLGALRAGAGLVEAAVPGSQRLVVDLTCTEVLVHGLEETPAGGLSPATLPRLLELARRRDAVLVGPGAGADLATAGLLVRLLSQLECPTVVDADGLNAFGRMQQEPRFPRACVVTPHSGELGRLLGVDSAVLQSRRVELVRAAAQRFGAVVLHKGAPTMVADPEGSLAVIGAGGPNLASPGTGDVLAGVVAALLAGGHPPFEAACLGAWLHGRAGDLAEPRVGAAGLIARDLLPWVAAAAHEAEEGSR